MATHAAHAAWLVLNTYMSLLYNGSEIRVAPQPASSAFSASLPHPISSEFREVDPMRIRHCPVQV